MLYAGGFQGVRKIRKNIKKLIAKTNIQPFLSMVQCLFGKKKTPTFESGLSTDF